jgi:hypothetical protein
VLGEHYLRESLQELKLFSYDNRSADNHSKQEQNIKYFKDKTATHLPGQNHNITL